MAITLAIPILFFGIVETSLRLVRYGKNLDLFVTERIAGRTYYIMNPDVKGRYFSRVDFSPNTSPDYFLSPKPPGTYRILALGGSTTVGFPYGHGGSFAAFLRDRLQATFPGRTIEMVNLGMTATNSFTTADILEEALNTCQPDLVLLYDGHNEFYGALGVASRESFTHSRAIVRLYLRLIHWKTFQFLRDLYVRAAGAIHAHPAEDAGTMMERLARGQTIALNSDLYLSALKIFRSNLADIAASCGKREIPIIMTTQVSNLRDQPPFVSSPDSLMAPPARLEYNQVLNAGLTAWLSGNIDTAKTLFKHAMESAPGYADAHYYYARSLDSLGRDHEAFSEYIRARDLDMLRFRTSSDFNDAIRDVGMTRGAIVVDMEGALRGVSPDSIIGHSLILEHLHPNSRGYFLMAQQYARVMRAHTLLADSSTWVRQDTVSDEWLWRNRTLSPFAERCATRRITILTSGWPFSTESGRIPPVRPDDPLGPIVEEVVQGHLTWEQGHVAAAEEYESLGALDSAALEYRFLVRQIPMNVSAHLLLGRTYLLAQDTTAARAVFQHSLAVEQTSYAWRTIGAIDYNAGHYSDAVGSFEHATALGRTTAEVIQAQTLLALAHSEAGQTAEAIADLEHILTLDPGNRPARAMLRKLENTARNDSSVPH